MRILQLRVGVSIIVGLKKDFTAFANRRTAMCDVNVFVRKNGVEEKVLENVDLIEEVTGGMRLVNIFGEEKTLNARMVSYNNSEKRMIFQSL